eukprot:TRINITY_DN2859_c0_g1_i2.p1 TRINITY_DN2859_c0_g1~~TRINITY_DN2859_c0_g1_i2.p1  ORF type:complete len:1667 (+),score=303.61 TRINITY_DN2859_c0_g1_i2:359-5002(+)
MLLRLKQEALLTDRTSPQFASDVLSLSKRLNLVVLEVFGYPPLLDSPDIKAALFPAIDTFKQATNTSLRIEKAHLLPGIYFLLMSVDNNVRALVCHYIPSGKCGPDIFEVVQPALTRCLELLKDDHQASLEERQALWTGLFLMLRCFSQPVLASHVAPKFPDLVDFLCQKLNNPETASLVLTSLSFFVAGLSAQQAEEICDLWDFISTSPAEVLGKIFECAQQSTDQFLHQRVLELLLPLLEAAEHHYFSSGNQPARTAEHSLRTVIDRSLRRQVPKRRPIYDNDSDGEKIDDDDDYEGDQAPETSRAPTWRSQAAQLFGSLVSITLRKLWDLARPINPANRHAAACFNAENSMRARALFLQIVMRLCRQNLPSMCVTMPNWAVRLAEMVCAATQLDSVDLAEKTLLALKTVSATLSSYILLRFTHLCPRNALQIPTPPTLLIHDVPELDSLDPSHVTNLTSLLVQRPISDFGSAVDFWNALFTSLRSHSASTSAKKEILLALLHAHSHVGLIGSPASPPEAVMLSQQARVLQEGLMAMLETLLHGPVESQTLVRNCVLEDVSGVRSLFSLLLSPFAPMRTVMNEICSRNTPTALPTQPDHGTAVLCKLCVSPKLSPSLLAGLWESVTYLDELGTLQATRSAELFALRLQALIQREAETHILSFLLKRSVFPVLVRVLLRGVWDSFALISNTNFDGLSKRVFWCIRELIVQLSLRRDTDFNEPGADQDGSVRPNVLSLLRFLHNHSNARVVCGQLPPPHSGLPPVTSLISLMLHWQKASGLSSLENHLSQGAWFDCTAEILQQMLKADEPMSATTRATLLSICDNVAHRSVSCSLVRKHTLAFSTEAETLPELWKQLRTAGLEDIDLNEIDAEEAAAQQRTVEAANEYRPLTHRDVDMGGVTFASKRPPAPEVVDLDSDLESEPQLLRPRLALQSRPLQPELLLPVQATVSAPKPKSAAPGEPLAPLFVPRATATAAAAAAAVPSRPPRVPSPQPSSLGPAAMAVLQRAGAAGMGATAQSYSNLVRRPSPKPQSGAVSKRRDVLDELADDDDSQRSERMRAGPSSTRELMPTEAYVEPLRPQKGGTTTKRAKPSETYEQVIRKILSWDFFKLSEVKVENMRDTKIVFESDAEYRKVYEPLVVEECRAQLEAAAQELDPTAEVTFFLEPLSRTPPYHLLEMLLPATFPRGWATERDILLLRHQDREQKSGYALAIVDALEWRPKQLIRARIMDHEATKPNSPHAKFSRSLRVGTKIVASNVYRVSTLAHQWHALQVCHTFHLFKDILNARSAPPPPPQDKDAPFRSSYIKQLVTSVHNPSQVQAICHALTLSPVSAITLIQGPPGTGKTKTIIGLLRALLAKDTSKADTKKSYASAQPWTSASGEKVVKDGAAPKILLCAPSNAAVDELVLRIAKDFTDFDPEHGLAFLRVGVQDKMHKDVLQYTPEERAERLFNKEGAPVKKMSDTVKTKQDAVATTKKELDALAAELAETEEKMSVTKLHVDTDPDTLAIYGSTIEQLNQKKKSTSAKKSGTFQETRRILLRCSNL